VNGGTRTELPGADGNTLVGDQFGGPGFAVLLTHGGGQTRHAWGATGRRLAAAGAPALSIDLRGHGESAWDPAGRYAFADHVRDVQAVVRRQGRPVVFAGASLGGVASLVAAPGLGPLARGIVLVDVTPSLQMSGVKRIVSFMRANPDGFVDLAQARAAIQAYQPHRSRQATEAGLQRNLRRRPDGRWVWHWDPATLNFASPAWLAKQRRDMTRAAATLRVPVVLIRGAESEVVSDEDAQALLQLVRLGRRIDVPNARHMVAGDENDVFSTAMITALRDEGLVPPGGQLSSTTGGAA
jgi:pimeloyl-ACP methyl ester carboxylesterase